MRKFIIHHGAIKLLIYSKHVHKGETVAFARKNMNSDRRS